MIVVSVCCQLQPALLVLLLVACLHDCLCLRVLVRLSLPSGEGETWQHVLRHYCELLTDQAEPLEVWYQLV